MASKTIFKSLLLFNRFLVRRLRTSCASHGRSQKPYPPLEDLSSKTIVCDIEGGLLRTSSTFPYFMLVALEAGGFLRGLLLLALYPFICCLHHQVATRVMVFVSFFGLREDKFRVGGAVLPKFFLECVGLDGFEVLMGAGRKVCATSMPSVMVEGFVKGYLDAQVVVVGRKLKVLGGYFTGLMELTVEEEFEQLTRGGGLVEDGFVGFGGSASIQNQKQLFNHCKEVYTVSEGEKGRWRPLPRSQYAKPLIFHDGRIAFRPTAAATLAMFLWLPFAFVLAFARAFIFILLPFSLSIPLVAFLGMESRLIISPSLSSFRCLSDLCQVYICNHRTLLDPLYISAALGRHVTASTYSVSRVIEWFSPVRTVRLSRDRAKDKAMLRRLLIQGDCLVVCPEGTTCREPYLLRFSPLAAELSREVVPVALRSRVGMFYGTSTRSDKWLDPLYFLMNPIPRYEVELMEPVATGGDGGDDDGGSCEVANRLQREIGRALGFECTVFTRKDKYRMLAGNDGIVEAHAKAK